MDSKKDADRDFGTSDCSSFRWPRGRYNGKRIVGASIKFKFSLEYFEWRQGIAEGDPRQVERTCYPWPPAKRGRTRGLGTGNNLLRVLAQLYFY
jgi:hypothetical protein